MRVYVCIYLCMPHAHQSGHACKMCMHLRIRVHVRVTKCDFVDEYMCVRMFVYVVI
jgi:hypothetical protein